MYKFFLVICVLFTMLAATNSENWCGMVGCLENHVACNENWKRYSNCPPSVRLINFEALKQDIVKEYNVLRNQVASGEYGPLPSAVRMAEMQWDDDLAWLASLNAQNCRPRSDLCRNTNKYLRAAQKMTWRHVAGNTSAEPDYNQIKRMIRNWFEEGQDVRPADIREYEFQSQIPIIAHFAIAVSEMNSHIGCGGTVSPKYGYTRYRLTCNFATGPEIGYPIYREGKAGSKCKTGMSKEYPSLCSTTEIYKNDELFTYRTTID